MGVEHEQQREKNQSARKGKNRSLPEAFAAMDISRETCPLCQRGENESEEGSQWICCDQCDTWFRLNIADDVPDVFVCSECVKY